MDKIKLQRLKEVMERSIKSFDPNSDKVKKDIEDTRRQQKEILKYKEIDEKTLNMIINI